MAKVSLLETVISVSLRLVRQLMTVIVVALSALNANLAGAQGVSLRATVSGAPATVAQPMVPSAAMPAVVPAVKPAAIEAAPVRVLLTPDVETVLLAQMIGRIVVLNGSLGSRVARGQLLVAMDCSENLAKLKMSEADLALARETYDSKVRLKGLDAAGEIEVSLAAASVSRANGQIGMTKAQIENCSVLAPFSGRIAKLNVKPHQGVNAGQSLVELVGDGPPRLRLNVPSKWLRVIRVGTSFEVEIEETGRTYRAAVTAINSRVDAVAQTMEIEARLLGRNPDLLAGMSGTARFGIAP